MKFRTFTAAIAVALTFAGTAGAATLSGMFNVQVVQVTGANSSASEATTTAFSAALSASTSDTFGVFTYTGALDFGTSDPNDATTIGSWLATGDDGNGIVDPLGGNVAGLPLSKPDIDDGTATTTFFLFTLAALGAGDFSIVHDDGIAVFDNGLRIGGFDGPNTQRTTVVNGFGGGQFDLLYVATNGDPSILRVDHIAPVPLPATLPLLLVGFGGLAFLRRRRARA